MRKAFVEPVALPEPRFRDGLGIRYVRAAGSDDPVEVMRPLWDVGAMQNAIRQRVGRLQSFRQARFVPLRTAEVPRNDPSTIEVVSDFVAGHRLSQYLEAAQVGAVSIETNAAIYVLRELIGALALLHESRGVTHGAVGPERILVTPKGRVVVADYVLGPAIERLEFTRPRLWREFRVPVPSGKGHPTLDDKADVMQVGMTALALLLGRPVDLADFPNGLSDLVATLNNFQRTAVRVPIPAALAGWVKRAVFEDPHGRFANVSDARLSLEAVVSNQDAASGGAGALKGLAETFGRYAADLEAKAAAAAAESARKAAQAAQAAAMDAIRLAAVDMAAPGANVVPAFELLADAQGGPADGEPASASAGPDGPPVVEADPPVGWRVPEAPPVEDTLPVSPLLQIDAAAPPAASEEFIEEVLDLTALAGEDGAEPVVEHAALVAEAVVAPALDAIAQPVVADEPAPGTVVEVIVDLRELEAAVAPAEPPEPAAVYTESAPVALDLAEGETPIALSDAMPSEAIEEFITTPAVVPDEAAEQRQPMGAALAAVPEDVVEEPPPMAAAPDLAIDATLAENVVAETPGVDAALAALETQAASEPDLQPDALPEWRLLADPGGATAPTIDVVEPRETLDELVAEFAAGRLAEPPPALTQDEPVAATQAPTEVEEPPAVVHDALPPAASEPLYVTEEPAAASTTEPVEETPSILDEILSLQDAQAAAQAAVETPAEPEAPAPDIAAWSFVEELMHRDARFDQRSQAEAPVAEPAPPLPADWFVEVGRPPVAQDRAAFPLAVPEAPARPQFEAPATPAPALQQVADAAVDEAVERVVERVVKEVASETPASVPPIARRPAAPEPEEDLSGPVFPRVAPSVQRVRAEARRRRWARLGRGVSDGLAACSAGCASVVVGVARGTAGLFSSAGRALTSVVAAAASGTAAAGSAVARGTGGAARAVASGLAALVKGAASSVSAVVRGVASGLSAIGRGAASGLSAITRGAAAAGSAVARGLASGGAAAARGLAALASATGSAARVLARATARASAAAISTTAAGASFTGRAMTTALGASVRFGSKAAVGATRAGGAAMSAAAHALANGLRAAGRAGSHAAASSGRALAAASAGVGRAGSAAGGVAGRGAAAAGKGIGRALVRVPRQVYFVISDVADRLPKPVFRPWYLAAALVVIVAVAGVPYAKTWLGTHAPALGTSLIEPAPASAPVAPPEAPVAAANGTGSIRVTVDPAGTDVLLDGMLQGSAPLTIDNLTEGTHTLLVRDKSGSVRQTVRVRGNETAEVTLKIRPGWLAVFAPVKLDVLENGQRIGSTEAGRILAAPGPHTVEVTSQAVGFRESKQVEIRPGEVVAITVQMPPVTIEIVAPSDSEILVDGQPIGRAPLGQVQIAVGTREITMRHPELGERRQVITVTYNGPARVVFE